MGVEDKVEFDADTFEGVMLESEDGDCVVAGIEEIVEDPDEDAILILLISGAFTVDSDELGFVTPVCTFIDCDVADTIFESEVVGADTRVEMEEDSETTVEEGVLTGAAVEEEVETEAEATEGSDDETETMLVEVGDGAGEGAFTAGAPGELGEDVAEEAKDAEEAKEAEGDVFLEGSVCISIDVLAGEMLFVAGDAEIELEGGEDCACSCFC